MNRTNKRRIDKTRKPRLIPVYECFSSGSMIKIDEYCRTMSQEEGNKIHWHKTYNTEDLPPNRIMTFNTDPNDVWDYSKTQ